MAETSGMAETRGNDGNRWKWPETAEMVEMAETGGNV